MGLFNRLTRGGCRTRTSGVPLVPVMMQDGYTAPGWLGILTAGLLWTPLFDPVTFDENFEQLVKQIYKTVVPDDTFEENNFSREDIQQELQRLRASDGDVAPAVDTAVSTAGAKVPVLVPTLPVGLRVTSEMKQIIARLDSSAVRVAFCGMGGASVSSAAMADRRLN